jgi:hypothetical protein
LLLVEGRLSKPSDFFFRHARYEADQSGGASQSLRERIATTVNPGAKDLVRGIRGGIYVAAERVVGKRDKGLVSAQNVNAAAG